MRISFQIFLEGGLLSDKQSYGSYETDGKIPLPQGADAFVFALSEQDKKLYYAESRFTASLSQTLSTELKETAQATILSSLSNMQVNKISIRKALSDQDFQKLEDVKKEIEKTIPKMSSCGCGVNSVARPEMDTVMIDDVAAPKADLR